MVKPEVADAKFEFHVIKEPEATFKSLAVARNDLNRQDYFTGEMVENKLILELRSTLHFGLRLWNALECAADSALVPCSVPYFPVKGPYAANI